GRPAPEVPLTVWTVSVAWAPWVLMSVLLLLTGLVRQEEARRPGQVEIGPLRTNYMVPIPALHKESHRDARLHAVRAEQAANLLLASSPPLGGAVNPAIAGRVAPQPEKAEFNFAWLTAPGTAVFLAALLSIPFLRMSRADVAWSFRRTFIQMKIPIPT